MRKVLTLLYNAAAGDALRDGAAGRRGGAPPLCCRTVGALHRGAWDGGRGLGFVYLLGVNFPPNEFSHFPLHIMRAY